MSNQVVLITGALTGIGRAAALAFAKKGAKVVVSGRRDEAGAALAKELRDLGSEAEFIDADVRKEDDVRALVDKTVARFGRLDVAVNNAATEGQIGPITDQTADSFNQQLVDLNTRERPSRERHTVQVLVLLDEFARLGHAAVIAHGFSYVAGYGLRLLPVLQSPAQLRAEYGPDLAEEIMANCGVEIAFAPKELKIAQDLSERLGYWTYLGRSNSRPTLLSKGGRSTTESDQRRALMMPQELIQMSADELIVLRAGMPPVRGRKIVYWRERAFASCVMPPPTVMAHASASTSELSDDAHVALAAGPGASRDADDLTLKLVLPALEAAGLEPLPPEGASDAEVEAWVERFIDSSVQPAVEVNHGR